MELDKRIKEGKRPLTCFDAEEAKKYVGKKCYLTNDISLFSDLDVFKDIEGCKSVPNEYDGIINTLSDIDTEISMVFETTYLRWKFCIPCEWVTKEKKEPKYREYKDLDEFFDVTGLEIGDLIKLKFPGNNVAELLIVGGCNDCLFQSASTNTRLHNFLRWSKYQSVANGSLLECWKNDY